MPISYDISIDDYHRAPLLSRTKIAYFAEAGPRAFWMRHIIGQWKDTTSVARIMGNIFEDALCQRDTWCLEPEWVTAAMKAWATKQGEAMELPPVAQPEEFVGKSTKAAKAWAEEQKGKLIVPPKYQQYYDWLQGSKDKEIAPQGFADFLEWGIKNFRDNTTAVQLVERCREQPTIRCDYEGTPGLQVRPDWYGDADNGYHDSDGVHYDFAAPDLKTTEKMNDFAHSAGKFGYAQQAALTRYLIAREHGLSWEDCRVYQPFIVVEKTRPYRCKVLRLNPEHIRLAWDWCQRQIDLIAEHMEAEEWPQVTQDEESFDLPEGALKRLAA